MGSRSQQIRRAAGAAGAPEAQAHPRLISASWPASWVADLNKSLWELYFGNSIMGTIRARGATRDASKWQSAETGRYGGTFPRLYSWMTKSKPNPHFWALRLRVCPLTAMTGAFRAAFLKFWGWIPLDTGTLPFAHTMYKHPPVAWIPVSSIQYPVSTIVRGKGGFTLPPSRRRSFSTLTNFHHFRARKTFLLYGHQTCRKTDFFRLRRKNFPKWYSQRNPLKGNVPPKTASLSTLPFRGIASGAARANAPRALRAPPRPRLIPGSSLLHGRLHG